MKVTVYLTFISDMPRLKKYSQIYGDDSGASVRRASQRVSQLSHTNGNTNRSYNNQNKQSQSESDIISDNSQTNANKQDTYTNKRYSQDNLKNMRNSHQSGNQNLNGQNKRTERKRVSKSRQVSGKYNPDQILKKMQEQCAKEQEDRLQKDQDQTYVQLPSDVLVGFQKKKRSKSNKKDKSGVKIKNKFFNNLEITQFQEYRKESSDANQSNHNKNLTEFELQQLQKLEEQQKQIQNLKNQKAFQIMNERKNQLQQKVSRIRGRLEFKNAHDDVRHKQHFQQTLENVRDCQQVDIMIQAPKIFKGSSAKQTDAALFIKNMTANGHQSQFVDDTSNAISRGLSRQKDQKEDKNKKIGRKQFYQQFTRQVKQNKAVQFPVVTNCIFKKTSLDELQFEKNEHLFKQDTNMRNSMSNKSINQRSSSNLSIKNKQRTSIQREKQRENSNSKGINTNPLKNITKQIKIIQQKQQEQSKPMNKGEGKEKVKATQQNQNKQQQKRQITKKNEGRSKSKPKSNKKNPKNLQGNENKSKQKTHKEKNKKNKKRRNKKQIFDDEIKGLFQQQAQDQSNGYGDNNGQSSQSDDNQSVQSIIDRKKVKIVEKHQREARKKYRNDIDKQDEQIMQKIKERILYPRKIKCEYDESSQSRKRRIERMEQARKKFEQEDGADIDKFQQCTKQQQNRQYVKEQEVFQKHLKELEQQQRAKGQKAPRQKSKKDKSKNKNGNAWKDIKVFTKVEALKTSAVNKRGGFINNDEGKVAGHKINNKNKKGSKQKNIIF